MRKPKRGMQSSVASRQRSAPRAVKVVGSLLVLQTIELVVIGLFPTTVAVDLPTDQEDAALSTIWAPLGLFAFVSAIGFFLSQPVARMMAMASQAIYLVVALLLYFTARPRYVYPIMISCVVIVRYLNYSEVVDAFRPRRSRFQRGERR